MDMIEPDLKEVNEILDSMPTVETVKDACLISLKEMLRNKAVQEGGGVYHIHDKQGRVIVCEEVFPDGTLRSVPEEQWYDFMDE